MTISPPVIIVADPSLRIRDLLGHTLKARYDAYVSSLDGTSDILEAVLEVMPSLVIAGVHGPLDVERIRQVRSVPQLDRVPIIALIAWGQEVDCTTLYHAGATACLDKPFDLAVLLENVGDVLSNQSRVNSTQRETRSDRVSRSRVGPQPQGTGALPSGQVPPVELEPKSALNIRH